ncbi:MAG: hypothetical protein JXQ87_00820 [Bacteroidia bacterium]
MKKYTYLIFLLLNLSFSTLWSQSYLGGEIQVNRLQNGNFQFNVTYIQNCVSCSEGANCNVPKQIDIQYANRSFKIPLWQDDATSIKPGKCSDCTRCSNDSCDLRYGYTTYLLRAEADLDSIIDQNVCTINAQVKTDLIDAQIQNISTGNSNVILMNTEFNACVLNSTPASKDFGGAICLGSDAIKTAESIEIIVGEYDDMVYSLNPITGTNGNASYGSGFSYEKPLYYLGFPRENLKFPRGFHLDSTKGSLMFRPMKIENTMVRIKVEEYRMGAWLSTTYKDLHFEVIKCPQNNAPVISGINCTSPQPENFKTEAVVEETVCFNICTTDKDKNDTIILNWNQGILGSTFQLIDSTAKKHEGRFCWTPTEADISKFPHTFVVNAVDNGCPVSAFTARSFLITVKDKPRFEVKTEVDDCGRGKIILNDTGSIQVSQWIVAVNGRTIVKKGSLSDTIELKGLNTGYHKYTITAIGANGSNNVVEDSLFSNGQPPFKTGFVNYNICPGDTAFFNGNDYLFGGTRLKWSDGRAVTDSFFSQSNDQTIYVYGNNGNCTDTLTLDLNVLHFSEIIEAKNRSGDAPLFVGFEITSPYDADSVFIDFGDGKSNTLSTFQFPYVHEYAEKGTYDVSYLLSYKGNTCSNTTVFLKEYINVFPTGIYEWPSESFSIYPNPTSSSFLIKSNIRIKRVDAFDVTGRKMEINEISDVHFEIVSDPKGIFLIEIEFINGQISRERVIIN